MTAHNYVRKYVRGSLWATLLAALVATGVFLMVFAQSGEAIVGGRSVSDGTYPFMVALLDKAKDGDQPDQAFCTDSLISRTHVLPAAHCVRNKTANTSGGSSNARIEVVQGRSTLLPKYVGDGLQDCVARNGVYIHPKYVRARAGSSSPYDVAILKLCSYGSTSFTSAGTLFEQGTPIALADYSQESLEKPGNKITLAGWGWTAWDQGQHMQNQMRAVRLPIVHDDDASVYPYYDPTLMLAAGGQGGKGSCKGDSGAPWLTKGRTSGGTYGFIQIGVHTGGKPCSVRNYPQYSADVNEPAIKKFITNTIKATP